MDPLISHWVRRAGALAPIGWCKIYRCTHPSALCSILILDQLWPKDTYLLQLLVVWALACNAVSFLYLLGKIHTQLCTKLYDHRNEADSRYSREACAGLALCPLDFTQDYVDKPADACQGPGAGQGQLFSTTMRVTSDKTRPEPGPQPWWHVKEFWALL